MHLIKNSSAIHGVGAATAIRNVIRNGLDIVGRRVAVIVVVAQVALIVLRVGLDREVEIGTVIGRSLGIEVEVGTDTEKVEIGVEVGKDPVKVGTRVGVGTDIGEDRGVEIYMTGDRGITVIQAQQVVPRTVVAV